ncbi:MHYT domain-containing protein [Sphingomonas glacialis]|uniref:MHYT domain-containing protein n=1 Tax=Sphingomonas glacialis TaxID=658225 RepID=UPI001F500238|nr:MHYT domain-containing protein [Sphingomonas glacialis]
MIAIIGAFTALSLASRIRTSSGRSRSAWLAAAATALGGGIWSMHFVAMLAFSMPGMLMSYEITATLLSLCLAIGFTGAGLAIVDWRRAAASRTLAAGLLIGAGVVSMHYLGMAGMRIPATLTYDARWVAVSVAIAMVAATLAVWLAGREHRLGGRAGASVAMGVAIAGMHYVGMYAATFTPSRGVGPQDGLATVGQAYLATAIGLLTLLVLLLGLGAVWVERLLRRGTAREDRLRFLTELNDRLFRSSDAWHAMRAASELLGRKLGASRCAYADVGPDGDRFWIRSDYTAPGLESSVGEYNLDLFGPRAASDLRAGQALVVRNVVRELAPGEGREMFEAIAIDAIICCPLISDDRLSAMMAVHQDRARDWTPFEISLVKEAVERCWAHVGRIGAEARLRESEERLRLAVDNAEVGFWDLDVVNDALVWPARTKAMFGISPGVPVTFENFYGGLHDDDREPTMAAFTAAIDPEQRALYDVEYRTVGKEDGVVRWVAAKGRGVFDEAGRCLRVAGTAVEITSRKCAEEALRELNATLEARVATALEEREAVEDALRQSQKMESMGQLTGGVAHDFNNLLTPIIGSLDLLQRKGVGGEREQRLIAGAMQSAERAKTLVQRLLAFARRQPLQPVAVDIGLLVQGMRDLVASTTGPQVELVIDVSTDLPCARADQNQLEMAILNLSVNARDAMPDGGTLHLSARAETVGPGHRSGLNAERYLYISVADTGSGMDEATLARAAEPFFSTKGVGKGTGLGLSMVHGLASQLGGALTLQSQIGVGTTVELWLPVSAAEAQVETMPEKVVSPMMTGTALVVDDEDMVRMTTADMLADLGYHVIEASSGEEALRLMGAGVQFDLLVTDHLMPGMTGTDLACTVRNLAPERQVLIVSGYAETAGIDATLPRLTKPFRRDDLASSLRQLIG